MTSSSDARLRQLERQWRATNSLHDRAAYLAEQLHLGLVPREAIEFAAFCGHPSAMMVTGAVGAVKRPKSWAQGLRRWGKPAAIRTAVLLGEQSLVVWERERGSHAAAAIAIASASRWLGCPCATHAAEAAEAGRLLAVQIDQARLATTLSPADQRSMWGLVAASEAALAAGTGAVLGPMTPPDQAELQAIKAACNHTARVARAATVLLGADEVWRLLREVLAESLLTKPGLQ